MKLKAVIEIPMGSRYKYEVHRDKLVLDRPLNQPIPHNYGYIPLTLCDDGDCLDVFVVSKYPIQSRAKVEVEILGMFECTDGSVSDPKLVGYLAGEQCDIFAEKEAIKKYLESYKDGFYVHSFKWIEDAEEAYNKFKLKK